MWDFITPCSTVLLLNDLFKWNMLRPYCPTHELIHAQNHENNDHAEFLHLRHGIEADALTVIEVAVILSTCLLDDKVM
jgi:hypothetical protein